MSKPKKKDGRGKSAGSKATQFSSTNQPHALQRKKSKGPPNAVGLTSAAIFEKVPIKKNGKTVSVPFIEGLMKQMRNNAFTANLNDQIKYVRQLQSLGIFDAEEYKELVFTKLNHHFKDLKKFIDEIGDELENYSKEYERVSILSQHYRLAYWFSKENCTCGACDKGYDKAENLLPQLLAIVKQMEEGEKASREEYEDDEFDDDFDEDEDEGEGLEDELGADAPDPAPEDVKESAKASKVSPEDDKQPTDIPEASEEQVEVPKASEQQEAEVPHQPSPLPPDYDPDNEFYSGMLGN